MLVQRCTPASVHGIDPSEEQLQYARTRPALQDATLRQGDAMALPFPDDSFDAAVMPLVLFFVPDPAAGVAEMSRVVGPGGTVSAYSWDMPGGGFPYAALHEEMRALGLRVQAPPSADASRMETLRALWTGAGLEALDTREITVHRAFADFGEYWTTVRRGPSVARQLGAQSPEERALLAELEARMRARLPLDADGRISYGARANAITGRVPTS
jgi:SAM-dependent methyltransferase